MAEIQQKRVDDEVREAYWDRRETLCLESGRKRETEKKEEEKNPRPMCSYI